jgi:N6-adenosine-specific RNA methylase IME4
MTDLTEEQIIAEYKIIRKRNRNAKRALRVAHILELSKGNNPLDTTIRYPIILADPPWKYNFGNEERSIQINYPTMLHEDICNLPISEISTPDAVLYLWATAPKLAEALDVINRWGFTYKTNAVWAKSRMITGYYFRLQHEHLLIATKGKGIPTPLGENRVSSIIQAPTRKHSQKPDERYTILEKYYPEFPKIELFARNTRDGWASWGNEV